MAGEDQYNSAGQFTPYVNANFPGFGIMVNIKNYTGGWVNVRRGIDRVGGSWGVVFSGFNQGFNKLRTVEMKVALVKIDESKAPSVLAPMNLEILKGRMDYSGLFVTAPANGNTGRSRTRYAGSTANVRFRVNFQFVPATCPTPTVSGGNTRTLSPVRWDELPSIGSVAKHQDLNLQFNNCSSHLSKISYKIDPSGNSPNSGAGLLPLRAPSTAQGLAVQVLERRQSDNGWVVSALGQWRERNVSGGSHTLPMGIRYYRTGNLVGGNVNAGMTISFQYQ